MTNEVSDIFDMTLVKGFAIMFNVEWF